MTGTGADSMATIDLNSDLGEGFGIWSLGDDEALLGVVTSANVACGFHAGDPNILRRVCDWSAARNVAIGAQVSYRDLAGFGRRSIDVEPDSLTNDVLYQIAALDGFARVAGTRVRYIKPHGALYNRAVHDERQAAAIVAAVVAYDATLPMLGLPGSALLRLAQEAGLATITEAFADRGYTARATLVPRTEPGALLHDPADDRGADGRDGDHRTTALRRRGGDRSLGPVDLRARRHAGGGRDGGCPSSRPDRGGGGDPRLRSVMAVP